MTTFGISAFLKLVHLSERPKRTELRKRLRGHSGGGYDYHRSLRIRSQRLVLERVDLGLLLADANSIKKEPERASTKSGLRVLDQWRAANVGAAYSAQQVTIESPGGTFKVAYRPDFGADISGVRTAVHVWNTMRPSLERRMVLATLAAFFDEVHGQGFDEIAVLSLRDGQLFSLADPEPHMELSNLIFENIDRLIEEIGDEGRRPPAEDRPRA